MRDIPFAVPPLKEQVAIVEHLVKATASIDSSIERTRREISLLREYRTRLIADVVAGKLDVREAASSLPNEPDELELDNKIDNLGSNENIDTIENEVAEDA
jgi:restriction endonuclease S subunit